MKKMFDEIRKELAGMDQKSAWKRGVNEYAAELLENLEDHVTVGHLDDEDMNSSELIERAMLNGASDWHEYSWGGCSLIYNEDIAKRLCCPSELKKTRNGERRPNGTEEWLDTQARALHQAARRVISAVWKAKKCGV